MFSRFWCSEAQLSQIQSAQAGQADAGHLVITAVHVLAEAVHYTTLRNGVEEMRRGCDHGVEHVVVQGGSGFDDESAEEGGSKQRKCNGACNESDQNVEVLGWSQPVGKTATGPLREPPVSCGSQTLGKRKNVQQNMPTPPPLM